MSKSAGTMAAIWALLSVLGLVVLIGVILVMMWFGSEMQHSPKESGVRMDRGTTRVAPALEVRAAHLIAKDAG